MANSKMIGDCSECDEIYCMECSDATDWTLYCSKTCEKAAIDRAVDEEMTTKSTAELIKDFDSGAAIIVPAKKDR